MVKKKLDLNELHFGITPPAFVGNARETVFAKSQWSHWRFPAEVTRVKIYKSYKYKH